MALMENLPVKSYTTYKALQRGINRMRLFILFCIFSPISCIANDVQFDKLRFVTVNEAPANYINENGEIRGFVVDIIKKLQQQLEIDNPIEVMPEARAMRTLDTEANIVMFSTSRTPERENKYHWLTHVITKRWIFYSNSVSAIEASTIDEVLDTKIIGVIRGDIREQWIKEKGAKFVSTAPNYEQAIEMLLKGRTDLLFFESFGVYTTLQMLGYQKSELKPQFTANTSDVYIVLSKSPESDAMAQVLRTALMDLQASSWYQSHIDKWITQLNEIESADAWVHDGVLQY